ncbi:hypothetical protein RB614_38050 [Phytohabitans sp. ZYX-F-186]|uniref:Dynamin family protein n=1 Tax=Phytohabitans maris TaxID=3071409 RepID=A0ABU0ZTN4_9ACTN|nr:hypothetical protein [Phytohabitans sp. ZYX-F-186]MDQ7910313.1 hypothetical protein [Phytohabitans sp. ZYX-F-186]
MNDAEPAAKASTDSPPDANPDEATSTAAGEPPTASADDPPAKPADPAPPTESKPPAASTAEPKAAAGPTAEPKPSTAPPAEPKAAAEPAPAVPTAKSKAAEGTAEPAVAAAGPAIATTGEPSGAPGEAPETAAEGDEATTAGPRADEGKATAEPDEAGEKATATQAPAGATPAQAPPGAISAQQPGETTTAETTAAPEKAGATEKTGAIEKAAQTLGAAETAATTKKAGAAKTPSETTAAETGPDAETDPAVETAGTAETAATAEKAGAAEKAGQTLGAAETAAATEKAGAAETQGGEATPAASAAGAGAGAAEGGPLVAKDPAPTLTAFAAFAAKTQPASEPAHKIQPARPAPAAHASPSPRADQADDTGAEVAEALRRLRAAIAGSAYPLALASAEDARRLSAALLAQLDDYLLPRLARLDAPLLVVVGGSTGAGKSTLVNSFVRAPVSPAGVLRPTTRTPVLVCNPADSQWFRRGDLLPGLTRTVEATADPNSLQIVAAPALPPGLAFIDAPDIDSVVDANRALAAQLLAAADLWLFLTTAARYADAVPWELLQTARFRGTVTALVLDRVPPEAAEEVTAHLLEMLSIHGLHAAPLFVLPETDVDRQGLLPERVTAPLREWFERIATDAATRAAVVRQTLDGALAALVPAVEELAVAADEQVTTADTLDDRVRAAYRTGRRTISQGVQDGRLLRGEVLARWQEFIGTGEFLRTLEARVGRLRDRVVAALTGRPQPGRELKSAIETNLVTLIRGAAADAAESAYTAWQAHPAGAALLEPPLGRPSQDLPQRAERLVRDWQRGVLELIRKEAGHKRTTARGAAYAVNATGLLVMVGVFASTAFIPTGAEVAVAGGTTVAAQKVLEAIFGDQAIRALATKAREDLISRTNALLDAEAGRYADRLIAAGISADPGKDLRDAAALVEYTRAKAELTSGAGLTLPGVEA